MEFTTVVGLGHSLDIAGNFQPMSPVQIAGCETFQFEEGSDESLVLIIGLTLAAVSDALPAR